MTGSGLKRTARSLEPGSAEAEADLRDITAAQRDPEAFAPVFHRYWPLVYRYCALRLRSSADAEDVASQIFVRALASLPSFVPRDDGAFRRWLFTIAHHEVASRHRYEARHPSIPLDSDIEYRLRAGPSPEQAAITAADAAHLVSLVRELPLRQREVVELRLVGLTDQEIAGVLGMSGPAVRKAHSRALAHLRRQGGAAVPEEDLRHV